MAASPDPPPPYNWRESFSLGLPYFSKPKSPPLMPLATVSTATQTDGKVFTIVINSNQAIPKTIPTTTSIYNEIDSLSFKLKGSLFAWIMIIMILTIVSLFSKSWITIGEDINFGLISGCTSTNSSVSCDDEKIYEIPNWFETCKNFMIFSLVPDCLIIVFTPVLCIKKFRNNKYFYVFFVFLYFIVGSLIASALWITSDKIKEENLKMDDTSMAFIKGEGYGYSFISIIFLLWPFALIICAGCFGLLGFSVVVAFNCLYSVYKRCCCSTRKQR